MTAPERAPASVWRDGPDHYGRASRLLHWTTVLLIILSFTLAWTWFLPGRGPLQNEMVDVHRMIGITVLLLSLVRIVRRLWGRPHTLGDNPLWIRILARLTQFALMALLVLIPLCGWAYTNAGGFEVHIFAITLPHLVPRDHYLEELTVELHETLATVLLVLVGLHSLGAVRHWLKART